MESKWMIEIEAGAVEQFSVTFFLGEDCTQRLAQRSQESTMTKHIASPLLGIVGISWYIYWYMLVYTVMYSKYSLSKFIQVYQISWPGAPGRQDFREMVEGAHGPITMTPWRRRMKRPRWFRPCPECCPDWARCQRVRWGGPWLWQVVSKVRKSLFSDGWTLIFVVGR